MSLKRHCTAMMIGKVYFVFYKNKQIAMPSPGIDVIERIYSALNQFQRDTQIAAVSIIYAFAVAADVRSSDAPTQPPISGSSKLYLII